MAINTIAVWHVKIAPAHTTFEEKESLFCTLDKKFLAHIAQQCQFYFNEPVRYCYGETETYQWTSIKDNHNH
jgi:hypothetical protein